jgi:LemA protein
MGILLLGGLIVLGVAGIGTYNSLIGRRNRADQALSSIEVQLTQRYDLISKLVETVRQYMGHERSLLEDIVKLRSQAASASTPAARITADNELSRAMTQLNVTMENYPQLRSSENFVQLQRSLNEVEEQISAARRSYNAAAVEYNNAIEMFPSSVIANAMSFQPKQLYAAETRKLQDVDMRALFKS